MATITTSGSGTATFSATSGNTACVIAVNTANVIVTAPPPPPPPPPPQAATLTLSPSSQDIDEGGSGLVTATLNAAPPCSAAITIDSNNPDASVPSPHIFTPGGALSMDFTIDTSADGDTSEGRSETYRTKQ